MNRNTRLNVIYNTMIQRCYKTNCEMYKYYGAKGVTVCDEWLDKTIVIINGRRARKGWFAFKKWALENGYKDNLSIDRISNSEGYSAKNCRWVTMKQQQNNRTNNRLITMEGRTQTFKQWCEEKDINYQTASTRINRDHWDVEKVLNTRR